MIWMPGGDSNFYASNRPFVAFEQFDDLASTRFARIITQ
jgi:hypothetical protein